MKNNSNSIESLINLAIFLSGQKAILENEKNIVVDNVEKAKKWLAKQPDYLKFLQHLQNSLHQKNIGAFSELLSYFVKDVLKKDKDIIFDLYTYHNLPALRIEAINDGCRENIYEGNGGSIANIVSTGLRLIALSRLPHRKFIVLDEPDCWLKPDHVPFFAKIIGEISEKLKIQTIIISHHDWNYFKDYGRVIRLETDGKNLEANIVHDELEVDDENLDYIKSIRLRQFMSHQDTVFNLHPYLTCLIGENDIGKSVLATAIKSVSYNDSSDSYIKHFTDEAQVLIELTKDRQILWQRFKTTNQENPQKVKYSLFSNNQLIASEFNSNSVPGFVEKELNIKTNEDIDVHIGNQKQPVFLLSSDTKPQDKAKILSLGKESIIIQKMMENIKSKTKQNKQTVKDGEVKFNLLRRQLEFLLDIDELTEKSKKLKADFEEIEKKRIILSELKQDLDKLKILEQIGIIEEINPNALTENLTFKNVKDLAYDIENLYVLSKLSELSLTKTQIEDIELQETKDLASSIRKLNVLHKAAIIDLIDINIKNETQVKDNRDFDLLREFIEKIKSHNLEMEELIEKEKNLKIWEEKINQEIKVFMKENNNICPTCKQNITEQHILGENHD